ncbi:unnamed protein product [Caenorhabditis sp. 36 PRJEB53466]|nr:unnamed protein product [Caenorhabditis sp. 36 PRJEB53466]
MSRTLLDYCPSTCLVCGSEAHGQHFGVETCRACAAFFRRSAAHREDEYVCKRARSPCEFKNTFCKYCRLQKCQQVGMSRCFKKVTPPKTVFELSDLAERVTSQDRLLYCVWHPITKQPTKWINVEPIIKRSRHVLDTYELPRDPQYQLLNSLEKMSFSLDRLRSSQSQNPKLETAMNFDVYFLTWEANMVRAAEWLMHSHEFRQLPAHEKLAFFKITWAVWRRFERMSMSADVLGKRSVERKMYLLDDKRAAEWTEVRLDASDYWKKGAEKYRHNARENLQLYFEGVVRPCLEWKFSPIEISFAISQIVWSYAGRKLLGQTLAAGELFLERISNDLHEYYRRRHIHNYAARLSVIMDMVNFVLKIQAEHEKRMEMVMLFDMMSVQLSDPQFFCV